MLFIIPIANLVLENILKLNEVILIPHVYFLQDEDKLDEDDKLLLSFNMGDLPTALNNAWKYQSNCFFDKNMTIAIIKINFSEKEFAYNTPHEDNFVLNKVCSLINKELDYIRLNFCNLANNTQVPTFPGIFKGGYNGVVVNMDNYEVRSLNGEICTNLNQHGIGINVNLNNDYKDEVMYKLLFSNRTDEVYLKCRSALRRINETYYFLNKDTIFVFLLSTLEFLASDEYIKFQNVKANIIPFLVNNKSCYHSLSDEFKKLSKNLRTPVVHCGKSLYEILPNEEEVDKLLNQLISYIINYCSTIFKSGVINFDELETEKKIRQKKIGLK